MKLYRSVTRTVAVCPDVSMSISVTLDMTAVASYIHTLSYIGSALALALAVGYEGYSLYKSYSGTTHVFDYWNYSHDADIAGVIIVPIVEQVLMAKCARNGEPRAFGKCTQCGARFRIPAAAAGHDQRSLCAR